MIFFEVKDGRIDNYFYMADYGVIYRDCRLSDVDNDSSIVSF
jgi:hypothetical protein